MAVQQICNLVYFEECSFQIDLKFHKIIYKFVFTILITLQKNLIDYVGGSIFMANLNLPKLEAYF